MSCQSSVHVVHLLFGRVHFFLQPYVLFFFSSRRRLLSSIDISEGGGGGDVSRTRQQQRNSHFLSCHVWYSIISCLSAASLGDKQWNMYKLVDHCLGEVWCFFFSFSFLFFLFSLNFSVLWGFAQTLTFSTKGWDQKKNHIMSWFVSLSRQLRH